jgi:signal transduction histidine kinase/DNA-binding NarL/FixJ family response regulator
MPTPPWFDRVRSLAGCALAPLLAATGAAAQSAVNELGRPFVENFTARDYAGQPGLFSGTQGPDRLMYFVNFGAVVIYDGRTWENIPVSDRPLMRVTPAPDGSIYVAPIDDFGRLRKDPGGRWSYESFLPRLPAGIKPLGLVRTIVLDGADVLFSTNRQLVRLRDGDPAQARVWQPTPPADLAMPATSPQKSIPTFVFIHRRLFVFQSGLGLQLYRGGELEPFLPDCAALRDPRIVGVLGGPNEGIRLLHAAGEVIDVSPAGVATPWPHQATALLSGDYVRNGSPLASGGLLIASGSKGAFVLGPRGELRHHLHEGNGLESNVLLGTAADHDGGIWLQHMSGTSRIDLDPQVTVFDRTNGLGRTGLVSIIRHHDRLYATSEEGLFRLVAADLAKGRGAAWDHLPSLPSYARLFVEHGGEFLFGTASALGRWSDDKFTELGKLPGQAVSAVAASGTRLLVGFDHGIRVFARSPTGYRHEFDVPGIDTVVLSMVAAGPGDFWVGTLTRGLLRLALPDAVNSAAGARVRPYGPAEGMMNGHKLVQIAPLADGPLFYSPAGLFAYDASTDRFKADSRLSIDGRPVAAIDSVTTAKDGRIFAQVALTVATNAEKRLGWFARAPGPGWRWHALPNRYGSRLGPVGATGLYFENRGGEDVLWAFGGDATLRIALDEKPTPGTTPGAVIRSAERGGNPILNPASPLPFSTLPLRISFSSPAFREKTGLRFQTRLVGYDANWSPPGPSPAVEFTNLPGGRYEFQVRAIDSEHRTGPAATLPFAISPPWHLTTVAYATYALVLAGFVTALVRWRVAAASRERVRLERLVAERTAELAVAKNEAETANRAKSTFLANMSHELRTPLNGVIGYAQVLMKDRDLSAKNRERVGIVQTSGEHLLRMINEVLDFSKIEAGCMELRPAPFHLPQLLRDIAAGLSQRAELKELAFAFDAAADLPELVVGDALKLRQVLDNLLGNAIKFTAAGTITLRIAEDSRSELGASGAQPPRSENQHPKPRGEVFTFTVQDTGVGIASADLATLFQPFHQVTDGRPPEPGTGLGLAISHRFVALMGGQLEVSSQRGIGTRFSFTLRLPVLAVTADAPSAALRTITGYVGPRRRLMLVDDVAINRHVLRELLEPLGFTIVEAASGTQALALAAAQLPDLMFVDLRMPGMDGLELTQRLRALPAGPRVKVIAMSASVLSFNRDDAFAAGCDDFLPKPFREEDLLARLSLALRLDWQTTAAAAEPLPSRPPSGPPSADSAPRLPTAWLQELLVLARRGEVVALRRRLAEARATAGSAEPLIDALDLLAKSYRMERIRERLENALSLPPP